MTNYNDKGEKATVGNPDTGKGLFFYSDGRMTDEFLGIILGIVAFLTGIVALLITGYSLPFLFFLRETPFLIYVRGMLGLA